MNELMKHESIVLLLCCSASLMRIDMSDEVFGRLIVSIANSTQATLDLIETTAMEERLWELFGNQEVMSVLVNNPMSMDAIVQNSKAFSVLLNTSGAMTTLSNSSVGREVLATALSQALTANEVCDTAREATMLLMGTHNKLIQGSTVTDLLNETHEQITKTVDAMLSLLSKTDVIFSNVSNLLDHTDAMRQMMNSRELMKLILSKTATKVAFLKAIESNSTLKQLFRESLESSGFYTKSKLTSKTWTPIQETGTDNYVVDGVVTAKSYALIKMTRLFVYDKEPSDNGATGPYKLYCDGELKKSGTIKGYKTVETEILLDYLCHSYSYSSTVTGLIPTDCMQKIEYYTYTIS